MKLPIRLSVDSAHRTSTQARRESAERSHQIAMQRIKSDELIFRANRLHIEHGAAARNKLWPKNQLFGPDAKVKEAA